MFYKHSSATAVAICMLLFYQYIYRHHAAVMGATPISDTVRIAQLVRAQP